ERFTRYLNKAAFGEESTQIKGKLYGIGVQIQPNDSGKMVIVATVEGTPAAAAGLIAGDIIEEIDGKPLEGLSATQASGMIRGPMDTVVHLVITRRNERKEFDVTRGEIKLRSVQTVKMLNPVVGYIKLNTFMSSSAAE